MGNIIRVSLNGEKPQLVNKDKYITAKLNQLVEFGYSNLKRETVAEQLENVLSGKEVDVIGMFIRDDKPEDSGL